MRENMATIKERPILFNGEMVRAVLDGRKTVTRRVVKAKYGFHIVPTNIAGKGRWPVDEGTDDWMGCPYGAPGDRLWVRETTHAHEDNNLPVILSKYTADNADVLYSMSEDEEYNGTCAHWWYSRTACPSIHMPRWASRILIEVVSVKVERVQEITASGAWDEGFRCDCMSPVPQCVGNVVAFNSLWWDMYPDQEDAANWDVNPWVWVVEFKRVTT